MRAWITRIAGAAIAFFALKASAQDCGERWLPGSSYPGVAGSVYAFTEWDPDGEGPQEPVLVVAGAISFAGEQVCNNIATWDGTTWRSLGGGVSGAGSSWINALAVYNGDLIACGKFSIAGGSPASNIARWNGSAWLPLGSGLTISGGQAVSCMAVYDGELIVGGSFTNAGGASVRSIARWNGASWQQVGTTSVGNGTVNTLAVYAGELVAAGSFSSLGGTAASCIARWNGSMWQTLGTGLSGGFATALAEYQGELVACGTFSTAGGAAVGRVARWNGSTWQSLGAGIGGTSPLGYARAMVVHDNALIVGGGFSTLDGSAFVWKARWDGAEWSSLPPGGWYSGNGVFSLASFHNELFVGGEFNVFASVWAQGLVHLASGAWSNVAPVHGVAFNWSISDLAVVNGTVYAGGQFSSVGSFGLGHIAAWKGEEWAGLGSGVSQDPPYPFEGVFALAAQNEILFAGGSFELADDTPANNVASWNEHSWAPLAAEIGGSVYGLGFYGQDLVATGSFTSAGGSPVSRIARWDGTVWHPLAEGLSGGHNTSGYAIVEYNGELVVGNSFTTAGTVPASNIAAWNGATWKPLGAGVDGNVYAGLVFGGELVVGGSFTMAGGSSINALARWNGTQWKALGSGLPSNSTVYCATIYRGSLVVGGAFTSAGGVPVKNIARWNGSSWQSLGAGLGGSPRSLVEFHGELIAGGSFARAGDQPSAFFARWTDTNIPWIARQPQPASISPGQPVSLTVAAATGYDNLSYQWRRVLSDNSRVNLVDDARITGATSSALSISSAILDDVGGYDCVVSNSCGSETSTVAALLCGADINGDTFVNGVDFDTFVDAFVLGDIAADYNHDTFVNGVDFDEFTLAFEAGC